MSKITIIVPVYKVEAYLKRCVDSILAQTFHDFQLILVDDGSPDGSPAICDEYASKDHRVQVIHKENGGLTSARLAGFQIAQGDFVSFIDSDDYVDQYMLEKLYRCCMENDADLAMCGYYIVSNERIMAQRLPFVQKVIQNDEITHNFTLPIIGRIYAKGYINVPGFVWLRLFKKEVLHNDCFVSEREYFTEDDLLNLIIAPRCHKIAIVNEPLYFYWQNMQSLTNSYRKNAWEMLLKRYGFCKEYCQKQMFAKEAQDRLDFNLFMSICFCVENACKRLERNLALREIYNILNHPETLDLWKRIDRKLMTKKQKLFYVLCKYKLCRCLHGYKRLRMCR